MNGYFDFNATTPLHPSAKEALLRAMDAHWHNPSSLYREAGEAKRHLEAARERLADLLDLDEPERVVFTSGATESNNIVMAHAASQERTVCISQVEHPCVREPARRLLGDHLYELPVGESGAVDLAAAGELILQTEPGLVSVMAANNETGVLQPWAEVREMCREMGVAFHCDAAQWIGKLPLDGLGECDWITGSAHKFGGPKGVGFLVVPEGLERLTGAQMGGPQERVLRAGTENLPAIAGMLAALEESENLRVVAASEQAGFRDEFEADMQSMIPGTKVVAAGSERLWNTSMMVVPEPGNLKWLVRLSHLGLQISTGSACSSGKGNPSHVMEAMGLSYEEMGRVLRISGGWQTSADDWASLGETLVSVWKELQGGGSNEGRQKRSLDLNNLSGEL